MQRDPLSHSVGGVLCADLDAMFAAVEVRERGLPLDTLVIVGGNPDARGVVSTCSYSARAFGVHSAMPAALARRLCPQALFLPPRHSLYSAYSQRVMDVLRRFGALEQVSIDEAFVDVGREGLRPELGHAVKRAVRDEIKLTCSVGLGPNKLIAKIGSGVGKPDGLTVVLPGEEASFLAPLPVGKLWGVGPKTSERLSALGVTLVRDLAALDLPTLKAHFGAHHGLELYRHARGLDDSEIVTQRDPKQLSREETFERDVADRVHLWRVIRAQSRELAERLEQEGLVARTVSLKLRYADFTTVTRSLTRSEPVSLPEGIAHAASALVRANWQLGRPVRLIGVACSHFETTSHGKQLYLPGLDPRETLRRPSR